MNTKRIWLLAALLATTAFTTHKTYCMKKKIIKIQDFFKAQKQYVKDGYNGCTWDNAIKGLRFLYEKGRPAVTPLAVGMLGRMGAKRLFYLNPWLPHPVLNHVSKWLLLSSSYTIGFFSTVFLITAPLAVINKEYKKKIFDRVTQVIGILAGWI